MPEVVYPSRDANGEPRTWDQVFPIWRKEDNDEYEYINAVLFRVAINNRFGEKTTDELKASLIHDMRSSIRESLAAETDDAKRDRLFVQLGKMLFYIEDVFDNLGGAYREYKTR